VFRGPLHALLKWLVQLVFFEKLAGTLLQAAAPNIRNTNITTVAH
jgi:hypothetical protein